MSVDHYENFPVASVLCPPAIRPAVVAIYHFARTADDIADEGPASANERLKDLALYRQALSDLYAGRPPQSRWNAVFVPLQGAVQAHGLPQPLLLDLIDAFARDVPNPRYANRAALLDYCRQSANPVGRLLLHLYGVNDALSLRQSDAICSALQLINFWQDLSVDLPRGRNYLPQADETSHGAHRDALAAELLAWAESLMHSGAPLALRLKGRAGWELRLVVQGGLRIAEKLRRGLAQGRSPFVHRPRLRLWDAPLLLWRALRMRHGATA